jgi:hypothetical protein
MIDFIKRAVKYYSKNPKGYWFKRKMYGWGWTPVKWQGWVFLLIWIALFVEFFILAEKSSRSARDTLVSLIPPFVLLVALLFLVCYGTGEKPKWKWGK